MRMRSVDCRTEVREGAVVPVVIVTGSGGLVGSESVRHFVEQGYDVVGIENDMRARFFGPDASTAPQTRRLRRAVRRVPQRRSRHPRRRRRRPAGSRAGEGARARDPHRRPAVPRLGGRRPADGLRRQRGRDAQPARGDAAAHAGGDVRLHVDEQGLRRPPERAAAGRARDAARAARSTTSTSTGIPTSMSIDGCLHSLFGASKAAADLLVQEYGRYFEMPTVCFRGGCLTGPEPRRGRGCTASSRISCGAP